VCVLGRWVARRCADGTGSGSRPKVGSGVGGVPIQEENIDVVHTERGVLCCCVSEYDKGTAFC
jgi:hypothetical protein